MAKRWAIHDDLFLHAFFDDLGDFIGTHDLGRPKGAATRRVAHLKETGAWAALDDSNAALKRYRRCLGVPLFSDEFE